MPDTAAEVSNYMHITATFFSSMVVASSAASAASANATASQNSGRIRIRMVPDSMVDVFEDNFVADG